MYTCFHASNNTRHIGESVYGLINRGQWLDSWGHSSCSSWPCFPSRAILTAPLISTWPHRLFLTNLHPPHQTSLKLSPQHWLPMNVKFLDLAFHDPQISSVSSVIYTAREGRFAFSQELISKKQENQFFKVVLLFSITCFTFFKMLQKKLGTNDHQGFSDIAKLFDSQFPWFHLIFFFCPSVLQLMCLRMTIFRITG